MADGRIGATVAELERRLASVRESVRASRPTLTEIFSDGSQATHEEPAPIEPAEPTSIEGDGQQREKSAERSGPSPVLGWQDEDWGRFERRILEVLLEVFPEALTARELASKLESTDVPAAKCDKSEVNSKLYLQLYDWLDREGDAPPYWSLREAEDGDETEPSATSDETRAEHTASAASEAESQESYLGRCSRCGGDVGTETIVSDEGMICGDCARAIRDRPSPDPGWRNEDWDPLSRKILNELDAAFPESLTASELVRRLRRSGSKPAIDVSDFKKVLYARLWDWIERDGEVSPEWSLREAEDRDEPLGSQPDGSGPVAAGEPRHDEGPEVFEGENPRTQGTSGTTDPSPGVDYAVCAMCMTERQASSLTRFRGRKLCPSCMDDLLG